MISDSVAWIVRPAVEGDFDGLLRLARDAGPGFTSLTTIPDRLAERLAWHEKSLGFDSSTSGRQDFFLLVLENLVAKKIVGTSCIYSSTSVGKPIYSLSVQSGRLVIDDSLNGMSEVGGLFLSSESRIKGLGRLLARARYLFIAHHRHRFADRIFSQLRGYLDAHGNSPFWDALGRKYTGISFAEASALRARHGSGAIAAMFPREPIPIKDIEVELMELLGMVHPEGRGAERLLRHEGFRDAANIDLLEAGPNLTATTDQLLAMKTSRRSPDAADLTDLIAAVGTKAEFRACLQQAGSRSPCLLNGVGTHVPA